MRRKFALMFLIVMISMMSIASFNPVAAPLARSLGMSDFQSGCLVSAAGLCWLMGGYCWGRFSRLSRKMTLLLLMLAYAAVLVAFAALAERAAEGGAASGGLFWLFLLLRAAAGFFFGGIPAKAQAYVMGWTTESTRTRGMALFGAANGLGFVLGPAMSGATASLSLTAPMVASAAMLLAIMLPLAILIRDGEPGNAGPQRSRATLSPFDPRIRPYLAIGLVLSVVLNIVQVTINIFMQDANGFGAIESARRVGIGLAISGILVALSQAVFGRRLRWSPERSMTVGLLLVGSGLGGFLTLRELAYPAFAALGLGIGLTMLGYGSGASLAVDGSGQRSVASYVSALQGGGSFLGPAIGAGLYAAGAAWPYGVCLALLAVCLPAASGRTRGRYSRPERTG
ncbi:MFS transporter [Cohnella fermenti]|uniref:TCR/Tet family MFS transporter n=1 Tax=Cohnella fermenti TaxID=2565925 RepID=A0A4S4BKS7_9BACL|nr:MFS transporter [Cohnella fermenti]THF74736.1 TCR/Tet family MFS transporter [Cohnella fermenti]